MTRGAEAKGRSLLHLRLRLPTLGSRPSQTIHAPRSRGPSPPGGAHQAVRVPPFRADLRARARARPDIDSRLRGAEVCVPELLLSADDPRRLLWRPAFCGAVGGAPPRPGVLLPVRAGSRHAARILLRRAAGAGAVGRVPDPHGLR